MGEARQRRLLCGGAVAATVHRRRRCRLVPWLRGRGAARFEPRNPLLLGDRRFPELRNQRRAVLQILSNLYMGDLCCFLFQVLRPCHMACHRC